MLGLPAMFVWSALWQRTGVPAILWGPVSFVLIGVTFVGALVLYRFVRDRADMPGTRLDERERQLRDRAWILSYQVLAVVVVLIAAAVVLPVLGFGLRSPSRPQSRRPSRCASACSCRSCQPRAWRGSSPTRPRSLMPRRERTEPVLYNRLAVLRAERALSRQDLADGLGVNYQTIGYLERGEYNPSLDLALRAAGFFGLPVEAIFSRRPFVPMSSQLYAAPPATGAAASTASRPGGEP